MAKGERDEMDDPSGAVAEFEATRPHLRSVALRLLGSVPEADDAVQEAWLRFSRADPPTIENPAGWLTTVVSRICFDMLRSRRSRGEEALTAVPPAQVAEDRPGPEQEAVLGDTVAAALLVVLDRLTPPERVAFVLHDLFGVSFEEIGRAVDRTPAAARQLASRARRRVRGADVDNMVGMERQRQVLEAFLRAARRGDINGLVELLAPDVVLRADPSAAALDDVPRSVEGATAVASIFSGRAQTARTALVGGRIGVIVQSEGQTLLLLDVTVEEGVITAIEAIADPARLGAPDPFE